MADSVAALVAQVKAALHNGSGIPIPNPEARWLGALVQAVEDQQKEVSRLRADGQRLTWLREHYFGANFRYGEPEESVLVFGPLPKSAKITGDFDADVGALAPPRDR